MSENTDEEEEEDEDEKEKKIFTPLSPKFFREHVNSIKRFQTSLGGWRRLRRNQPPNSA